ncbi:MAG TPA: hypothetical protein V6D08_14795 [Candidatus Obscuribacterales bacterium]
MHSTLRWGLVLAALLVALPAFAQDAKKAEPKKGDNKKAIGDLLGGKDKKADAKGDPKGKDDKKPAPDDGKKRIEWGTYFLGKLQKMEAGTMTFKVKITRQVPYPDAAQRLFNWKKGLADRYTNILRERNPIERQRQLLEYQKALAQPPQLYRVETTEHDFTVRPAKELIVRVNIPDPQYDSKGNLIPLTKEKLKELQGPEGYPGFPAQMSDLAQGSDVYVYLARPKNTGKQPDKKAPTVEDLLRGTGNNEKQVDDLVDPRIPEAVMVMIVRSNLGGQ